jgi:hypothetical protein
MVVDEEGEEEEMTREVGMKDEEFCACVARQKRVKSLSSPSLLQT